MSLRTWQEQAAREDEWFEQKHPEVVAEERRQSRKALAGLRRDERRDAA